MSRRPVKRLVLLVVCFVAAAILALVATRIVHSDAENQAASRVPMEPRAAVTVVERSDSDDVDGAHVKPAPSQTQSGHSDLPSTPSDASPARPAFVMPEGADYEPDVTLVSVSSDATVAEVNELIAQSGSVVAREVTEEEIASGVIVLEVASDSTIEDAINELSSNETVVEAQPDYIYHVMVGDEGDLHELLEEGLIPSADEAGEAAPEEASPAVDGVPDADILDEAGSNATDEDVSLQEDLDESSADEQEQDVDDEGSGENAEELSPEATEEQKRALDELKDVVAVSVNDQFAAKQWALSSIRAYEAWSIARVEGKVTVAVMDQGVEVTHEDLAANIKGAYNAHTEQTELGSATSHGTHVAGIIGAVTNNSKGVAGITYNGGLLLVVVFDEYGNCSTTDLLRAYNYVMEHASEYNVRVVNLSLGGKATSSSFKDNLLIQTIEKARSQHGIVTVAAAGNSGSSLPVPYYEYPGDADSVVSVMNLCRDGDGVARYETSNYNVPGQHAKNISAPGASIYSTWLRGSYGTLSGTSMSAPYAAGVLALEFAANPELSADEAVRILYGTAKDLGEPGWDEDYGFGEVDAYAAVRAAADGDIPMVGPDGSILVSLASAKVLVDPERMPYTGNPLCPDVVVLLDGVQLEAGTDYTLSFDDNLEPGIATVTVTGIGHYLGTKTATFEIMAGKWIRSGSRWWYRWSDGSYPANQFAVIDGKTYAFDASGWMLTGWQKIGGSWYYFDSSGSLATGWRLIKNSWYYLNPPDGKMVTGWKQVGDTWYHFASSGVMTRGWFKSGSTWYYLKDSGAMCTGWAKIKGVWYWFDDLGRMTTGWQLIQGKWYWFNSSGAMAASRWIGGYYYVGSDGAMLVNTITPDGYRVGADGRWDGKGKVA